MIIALFPLGSLTAFAANTATVKVESVSAIPGSTVDVAISIKDNPGIASMGFTLSFDVALTLVGATNGEAFSELAMTPPAQLKKTGSVTGSCRFAWLGSDNVTDNGVILNLIFNVDDNAELNKDCLISICCNKGDVLDDTRTPVDITTEDGKITIINYTPGDVDGNSTINMLDVLTLCQFYVDGCQYDPNGYAVNINPESGDVDASGFVNMLDVLMICQYYVDGCKYDPDGYGVKLLPGKKSCEHSMQHILAKDATCTEDGNIEYWYCEKCNEYFADENGNDVITPDYTVIKASGHTYSKDWSYDDTYHWHSATCGHTDLIAGKATHTYNEDHICSICDAPDKTNWKLSTPVIQKVEYDTVYWNAVENADYYMVCVNDNYECTLRGTSCSLADVKWNGNTISQYGTVKITVQAIGHDGYETSEKSAVNNTYFYVPETKSADANKLIGYSIGFGYNVVEDEYLDITQCSDKSVFNVGKLLTIGNYTARNHSGGTGTAYNYKSIDEFVSKTKVSFEYGQTVGCALIGSLKTQINADVGFDFKKYAYNETFVYEYNLTYKDHIITNFSDDNLLAYCLSNGFLKDIKKESVSTKNMTDDQLVEYLYNTYGTHAILGITTGGSYSAKYNISTNSQDIAAKVELGFSTSTAGGGALDQIIQKDFNIDASVSEEIQSSTSETKADFSMSYNGGNGGAATSPSDVSGAVSKWSSSISEDNAVSIKFTENGAISIATVLSYIDGNLSSKFADYIDAKADETYYTLFGIYNKSANLPVSVETVDNQNILIIDISGAQNGGDIRQYSYPNLVDGIFTVYPVMCNRNIDGVRIIGAYDEYQNLIDSFSLKLAQQWKNGSIDIILDNVGIFTNENGLIDLTSISFDVDVTVDYIGQNEIVAHDATDTADAQSAIIASNLIIQSSDVESRLIVRGGNGRDGIASGEDGTDGAIAIIADNLTVDTSGKLLVYGGDGGNAYPLDILSYSSWSNRTEGDGGNGNVAVKVNNLTFVNSENCLLKGGNGGNGGYGRNGNQGPSGNNPETGYIGTNGGDGGNGANAVIIANTIEISNTKLQFVSGDGGDGGNGGNGGKGGHNTWTFIACDTASGGHAGDGGKGGNVYYVNYESKTIYNDKLSSIEYICGEIGSGGSAGIGGAEGTASTNINNHGSKGKNGVVGIDGEIITVY